MEPHRFDRLATLRGERAALSRCLRSGRVVCWLLPGVVQRGWKL